MIIMYSEPLMVAVSSKSKAKYTLIYNLYGERMV